LSSPIITVGRDKLWVITSIVIGVLSIMIVLMFGLYLSSIVSPFISSVVIEIMITGIIIGMSWAIHTRLLKNR
jgi:hypothetical protein